MSIILRKYFENNEAAIKGRVFHQTLEAEYNLDNYFIDESLSYRKSVTLEDVITLSVSFGELLFVDNEIFRTELTSGNLSKFLFGIQVIDANGRFFAGKIEKVNYDEISETWEIHLTDWLKHHTEYLKTLWWENPFYDLIDFLRYSFSSGMKKHPHDPDNCIISGIIVSVGDHTKWSMEDQTDILNNYLSGEIPDEYMKTHTLYDLLKETLKHYSAYLYVDENLNLNFISTNYNNSTVKIAAENVTEANYEHDITYKIIDADFIRTVIVENEFDGVLVSQKTKESDNSYEVTWRLLRYIDGEISVQKIFDEEGLEEIEKDLKLIDLRQELGRKPVMTVEQWKEDKVKVQFREKYKDANFWVFPQREFEDTLDDYKYFLMPNSIAEVKVMQGNYPLLSTVLIDGVSYQIYEIDAEGIENEDTMKLRRMV